MGHIAVTGFASVSGSLWSGAPARSRARKPPFDVSAYACQGPLPGTSAYSHCRRAPCKGGAFQRVQAPPGNRSSRKQPEQLWR